MGATRLERAVEGLWGILEKAVERLERTGDIRPLDCLGDQELLDRMRLSLVRFWDADHEDTANLIEQLAENCCDDAPPPDRPALNRSLTLADVNLQDRQTLQAIWSAALYDAAATGDFVWKRAYENLGHGVQTLDAMEARRGTE